MWTEVRTAPEGAADGGSGGGRHRSATRAVRAGPDGVCGAGEGAAARWVRPGCGPGAARCGQQYGPHPRRMRAVQMRS